MTRELHDAACMLPRLTPQPAAASCSSCFSPLTRRPPPSPCAVLGILKGFDQMMNVVLENCVEYLRDPADPTILTDKTRHLGLVVCKGRCVSVSVSLAVSVSVSVSVFVYMCLCLCMCMCRVCVCLCLYGSCACQRCCGALRWLQCGGNGHAHRGHA